MTTENTMTQHQIALVLCENFHVSKAILGPENWDKPLTGNLFRLSAIDLTYLLFGLERDFKVRIPQHFLEHYGFCSINNIADALAGCGRSLQVF